MLKIQDVVFVAVLIFTIWRKSNRLATIIGLFCLILPIPLFGFKIMLFTAERLTWYAAGFILLSIIQQLYAHRN